MLVSAALRVHAAVTYSAIGDTDRARRELETAFERAPWPAIALRAEASELAKQLGVPVPTAWSL